jgi:DNA gyrase subunit B
LWEAHFTDAQGAERKINWELASTPEYRQMISKYKQIQEFMEPPFIVETIGRSVATGEEADEELSDTEREALAKAGITEKEKKSAKPVAGKKKAATEKVEKQSPRELFDYVLSQGKKDFNVQRYKGLGEMTANQLWETTLDPEKRTLLTVKMEDLAECETIFTTLMGEDVESRRKFIEENALDVKNLDI